MFPHNLIQLNHVLAVSFFLNSVTICLHFFFNTFLCVRRTTLQETLLDTWDPFLDVGYTSETKYWMNRFRTSASSLALLFKLLNILSFCDGLLWFLPHWSLTYWLVIISMANIWWSFIRSSLPFWTLLTELPSTSDC